MYILGFLEDLHSSKVPKLKVMFLAHHQSTLTVKIPSKLYKLHKQGLDLPALPRTAANNQITLNLTFGGWTQIQKKLPDKLRRYASTKGNQECS